MQNVWHTIESWLAENAPHLKDALRQGIQDDEVARFEKRIGVKLPADFVAFYKIHNGQEADSEGLIDTEELLSFERIMEEWMVWKDLADTKTFEEEGVQLTSDPDSGVKNDWWNPFWIPFTYDGSGNHYCLDLDPAEGGNYGQVIRMWHDDAERPLLAGSFEEWMQDYAQKLQAGEYVYSEDWGGIINKEEID